MNEVQASTLLYRQRFWYLGKLWQHCGWHSAAYHICGFGLQNGEREVIANIAYVTPFEEVFTGGLGI